MVTSVFGWHVRHPTEHLFGQSIAHPQNNNGERAKPTGRFESLGADSSWQFDPAVRVKDQSRTGETSDQAISRSLSGSAMSLRYAGARD